MRPTKTCHSFSIRNQTVKFNSNFDSGNLRTVTQLHQTKFLIQSALDSYQIPVSSKSFFHFCVENYPIGLQIQLKIINMHLLNSFLSLHKENDWKTIFKYYTPWYSTNGQNYERIPIKNIQIATQGGQAPTLNVQFIITTPVIFFSFAIPYSYERYLNMIRDLPDNCEQFYLRKEVLCYSLNLNLVYMLTITSFDQMTEQEQTIASETNGVLLPQKHLYSKRKYFNKPIILISGRVHPGETPSSWAIEGIIKYLTSNHQKAVLLRKYFMIVIVPMLNPDGVYEGMYRLDTKGHNLNRYYQVSDNRQPSIYAMKHLIKHFNITKRLLFFFDIHGHPSLKGSFMYGNAIDDIAYQAETQLFARLMTQTCSTFEENYCIFDRQQMKSKDRYDAYTKQGCARVYALKTANILHSYTFEMGFHSSSLLMNKEQYKQPFLYRQQDYYSEGIAIVNSVLMASGLIQNECKTIRKQLAFAILNRQNRFRKQDKHVIKKAKNAHNIIRQQYWKQYEENFFKKHRNQKVKSISVKRSSQEILSISKPALSTSINGKYNILPLKEKRSSSYHLQQNTKKIFVPKPILDYEVPTKIPLQATNMKFQEPQRQEGKKLKQRRKFITQIDKNRIFSFSGPKNKKTNSCKNGLYGQEYAANGQNNQTTDDNSLKNKIKLIKLVLKQIIFLENFFLLKLIQLFNFYVF